MSTQMKKEDISRRRFIALAGTAAMAGMAMSSGWAENNPVIDADTMKRKENETDVLVIGGGMAGLFAAVKANDAGANVTIVTKGRFGASGLTPFAKGIFVYDPDTADISLDEFTNQVTRSALGTNNPVYTRQMAEHSLARAKELKEWGFFDSHLCAESFNKPVRERTITVLERVVITHLVKDNGRISGAAGFSLDEEMIHFFNAKSVILCTGAGGFKPNGFPVCELTHDGTVMAYNIGAMVTGKEWNDGHPGQAENAADCFNGWHDMFERTPGTTGVEVHHDLGVDLNYRAYMTGNPVSMGGPGAGNTMGLTGGPYVPAEFKRNERERGERGPRHDGPPREGGISGERSGAKEDGAPPGMAGTLVGGSSAGMSIHKSEGLVPINDRCESNIPGLYAAGDALGSYMAGAIYTQVGSSLAGSAVQGAIAGEAAAKYCRGVDMKNLTGFRMDEIQGEILAPLKKEAGYSPAWVTQTLQGIMIPNFVIYIKKESILKAALAYVEELRDHHMPMLRAADLHELRLAFETANMITTAEMKLRASLMRKESRCSHYRLDYPEMDNENWQAWINISKGSDGSMQLEKQAFGTWPS